MGLFLKGKMKNKQDFKPVKEKTDMVKKFKTGYFKNIRRLYNGL